MISSSPTCMGWMSPAESSSGGRRSCSKIWTSVGSTRVHALGWFVDVHGVLALHVEQARAGRPAVPEASSPRDSSVSQLFYSHPFEHALRRGLVEYRHLFLLFVVRCSHAGRNAGC